MINDLPMDVNKWYICLLAPISWSYVYNNNYYEVRCY